MKYSLPIGLFVVVAFIPSLTAAQPPPNAGVRFALHAIEAPGNPPPPVCPSNGAADPVTNDIPCSYFTTARPADSYNWVYLVVGGGDDGINGVSFGVEYSGLFEPGYLSTSGWTLCPDGLDFPSVTPAWPASGSGMTITWTTCQSTRLYDYGIHAVVAKFYMYAYAGAQFGITPNLTKVSGPELDVNTCDKGTTQLLRYYPESVWDQLTGRVDFGGGFGYTPCIDLAVETSTWGRIKTLYNRATGMPVSGRSGPAKP